MRFYLLVIVCLLISCGQAQPPVNDGSDFFAASFETVKEKGGFEYGSIDDLTVYWQEGERALFIPPSTIQVGSAVEWPSVVLDYLVYVNGA